MKRNTMPLVDYELENELKPMLSKDEKLLWAGKPEPGIKLDSYNYLSIGFILLWCVGVFFMFRPTFQSSASNIPLPFIFILLFLVGSILYNFIRPIINRKNSIYGLTDKRIIIKAKGSSGEAESLNIKVLPDIKIEHYKYGFGTLTFGPEWFHMQRGLSYRANKLAPPKFFNIPEVQRVYSMIIELQHSN